jgi:GH25 family lysozyme M1 (1,4-beta-N-acetylmuramidase)
MSRAPRKRVIALIAVANVLASAGAGVAAVAMSGGNGAARAFGIADTKELAAAAAKPPPVVDGVRRYNVGSAHSPQLSNARSGGQAAAASALPSGAVRGIDVASWEHPQGALINWSQVSRAGYKFAFIKASEGNYYANPYYATDLSQAKAAGLYVTGYHFAVPNVSSGTAQADYAVRKASYTADGRTMPLALDIEYNPYGGTCYGLTAARMVGWISAFTAEVQRLTGQPPIIYSTADWWRSCTGDTRVFDSDPLWIAAPRATPAPLPSGWQDWTFWQYSSTALVPGITGRVDVSYFGLAMVRLLDPGAQRNAAGTAIRLQVRSLNAAAGQPLAFAAADLPRGLSISASGLITGIMSASGAGGYTVTVTAGTPSGGTGSVSFRWAVTSPATSSSPAPRPTRPSPHTAVPTGSPAAPG